MTQIENDEYSRIMARAKNHPSLWVSIDDYTRNANDDLPGLPELRFIRAVVAGRDLFGQIDNIDNVHSKLALAALYTCNVDIVESAYDEIIGFKHEQLKNNVPKDVYY